MRESITVIDSRILFVVVRLCICDDMKIVAFLKCLWLLLL